MPRFAANLSLMFTEAPFLDRFAAAARAGFRAVEFQFVGDHDPKAIRAALDAHDLELVLFNAPAGDWAAGERGLACLADRSGEVDRAIDAALRQADAFGARFPGRRIHVMAGLAGPSAAERSAAEDRWVRALGRAARRVAEAGITLMVEPINPVDMPGYLVTRTDQALDLVDRVGAPALSLQLDLYHRQMTEGRLTDALEAHLGRAGHVQIAGVPGRHEPDGGEIGFPFLFDRLDALGYAGWVGCEYRPRGRTEDGLGWFAPFAR